MSSLCEFSGSINIVSLVEHTPNYCKSILIYIKSELKKILRNPSRDMEDFGYPVLIACYFNQDIVDLSVHLLENGIITEDKFNEISKCVYKWQKSILSQKGMIEGLWIIYEYIKSKGKDEKIVLNLLRANNQDLKNYDISLKNIDNKDYIGCNLSLIRERDKNLLEDKRKNHFKVLSKKNLNEFSFFTISDVKKISKENNFPNKHSLQLLDQNMNAVLYLCSNQKMRKEVFLKSHQIASEGELNNLPILKKILLNNYKFSDNLGYSSASKLILQKEGIKNHELNKFFNTAKKEIYTRYSECVENLALYASNNLDIPVMNDWDISYVMEESLKENYSKYYNDVTYDSKLIWTRIKKKIENLFSLKIKEGKNKVNKSDKDWSIFRENILIGKIYITTSSINNYCVSLMAKNNLFREEKTQLFIALSLGEDSSFENIKQIEVTLHELGHALQHIYSLINIKNYTCLNVDIKHFSGIEKTLIEFPSQWLEDFAYNSKFLKRAIMFDGKMSLPDDIECFINFSRIKNCLNDWENLYLSRLDWILHKNKNTVKNNLETKIRNLKKEFGFYCSEKNNAINELNNFSYFHMKGAYFSYLFSKNAVRKFNNHFKHLSDRKKAEILKEWFAIGYSEGVLNNLKETGDLYTYKDID